MNPSQVEKRRIRASAARYLAGSAIGVVIGALSALLAQRYIGAAGGGFVAVIFFQRFLDRRRELKRLSVQTADGGDASLDSETSTPPAGDH